MTVDLQHHMARVAGGLRRRARHGLFDGSPDKAGMRYLAHCKYDCGLTRARLIFTRDTGHHSSGWLKNPDYERCWHLSTSPMPDLVIIPGVEQQADLDKRTTAAWLDAFFREHVRYLWAESPKSEVGKQLGVWHWRLFCDEHWRPLLPRKEVYTREFTEAGWRSASQVLGEDGYHRSETEDGRIIESTVDPT